MELASALRSFAIALRAANQSPRTIAAHGEAVTGIFRQFPIALDAITRDHVRMFLANVRWSPATRLIRWKGLRTFFDFCVSDGFLTASPVDGVVRPKSGKARRPPKYEPEDIEMLLLACCERNTDGSPKWLGLRDQAIILVLATTPARVAELCRLSLSDVYWDAKEIAFRQAKGGTEYRAILFPQTARALDRYIRARPFKQPSLWLTRTGGPMEVHAVQLLLRRLKAKTGMTKRLNAHSWRHNFAMRTVDWGLSLDETAKLMGHRSTKATEIYRQWSLEEQALSKIRRIAG